MTDIKEKLSALYDGELESSQIDDLLEECRNNDELIRSFSLYGLISQSLNQESKVSQISQARRKPKSRGFSDIWLSNAVTAAASIILTLFSVYLTTKHFFTSGQLFRALSVISLSGIFFPPLIPSSAVTIYSELQSLILPAIESEENPPNIMECIAPILAHASITYANSGIIVK